MLKLLQKLPIRKQLLILVVCTVSIMFLLIFMIYFQVSKVIENNNSEYTGEIFTQIKRNITENCDMLERILISTAYSNVVQSYMSETDQKKKVELFKNVDTLCISMQEVKNGIIDFIILSDNGNKYFLTGEKEMTLAALKKLPDNILNYYSRKEVLEYSGRKIDCFIVASTIYSINKDQGKKIGLAAIVVDAKLLSLEANNKFKESTTKFYLLDRDNNSYSNNEVSLSAETPDILKSLQTSNSGQMNIEINHRKYVVNNENIPQTSGKIISIVPEDKLFSELIWIRKLTFAILALAIILLSIPFTVIINNILRPLKKFMYFISGLKSGNLKGLKQRINLKGYSEVEIMSGEFNNMLDEIDGLTHRLINTSTRLYEAELEKKQAELMYLKSQINPHFLYNTLESMIGTAYEEGAKKTIDMIKSLVVIFRYSVKGSDIVQLQDELEIIKSYIYIQQIRFVDMFDVIYQFEPDTLKCSIPKIILQPIVENSIYHGLETKLDHGHLWIGSKFDEQGNLCIWINDDGTGMDINTLENIKRQISGFDALNQNEWSNNRIGVVNVNNRIKLTYGMEYGIDINSEPGKGTSVSLKIPVGRKENV